MKYFNLIIALGILAASCNQPAKKTEKQEEIDPKNLISCQGVGEVKLTYTHEELAKRFAGAISEHENNIAGKYTTLWQDDAKQLNIFWKEKSEPFKLIKYIEVVNPASPYLTKDSVKVGLTMRELVKINGFMPITFINIWQANDAGLITTFNGGNIQKTNSCLSGVLDQVKVNVVHVDEMKKYRQKREIESSDPLLNRIDMELSTIRITAN